MKWLQSLTGALVGFNAKVNEMKRSGLRHGSDTLQSTQIKDEY